MSKTIARLMAKLVYCYALLMLAWGVLGFVEFFTGYYWPLPLQNNNFPQGTQFLHWLLISACGAIYLGGYTLRWRHTPFAMTVVFAMLAAMCFIQTVDFMTRPDRYVAYAIECSLYILLARFLFRARIMQARFGLLSTR